MQSKMEGTTRSKRDPYKSGQKALTKKEYAALLNVCGSFEDILLLKLAVSTGIRRDDIVHIEIKNIDLENCMLTYYEKKKKRMRSIPISDELVAALKAYIKTVPKSQVKLFPFCSRTAYERIHRMCTLAGIEQRPFHSLRATCAKFCQQAGWSEEQTAQMLGDTTAVVHEYYLTPSFDEMREVVRKKSII